MTGTERLSDFIDGKFRFFRFISLRVKVYNTKLSYRNTMKTHFHTNAIITQNILEFFKKLTIFEISFEWDMIFKICFLQYIACRLVYKKVKIKN